VKQRAIRKPSILVVDDSDDGREMLVEYLMFRGFEVASARDGAEAIEVARRVRPHVILMDLSMPGMDGWEATRRLKSEPLTKHITILAFTAHVFAPEQERARSAGCDAIIAKPFDLVVLAERLSRIHLDSSANISEKENVVKASSSHKPDASPSVARRPLV
jgi:two-component system cell cycle response regulator DivK